MVARVMKRCQRKRRVVEVVREVLCGAKAEVISRVIGTQRSLLALINTAYIERLNATFRERLGLRWHVGHGPGRTSTVR